MTTQIESAEDWKVDLEEWQWDGRQLSEIIRRLDVISIHFSGMMKDWAQTVPDDCRGSQFYVSSANPYNSLEEIHSYAETMAVDQSGSALVRMSDVNTYTDADSERFVVMTVKEARELVDDYKWRRLKQEADADKTLGEGLFAAWPRDYSYDP